MPIDAVRRIEHGPSRRSTSVAMHDGRMVVALAGAGPGRDMLLAASTIDGRRAFDLGMVQRLGDLDDALAWAAEIAALAPLTIAGHKLTLERGGDDPAVADAFARAWGSADVREGRAAFAERRPPKFTGS